MDFTVIGDIADIETFATGRGIRELERLRKKYGKGRWRERKGVAKVRLSGGAIKDAELHWVAVDPMAHPLDAAQLFDVLRSGS